MRQTLRPIASQIAVTVLFKLKPKLNSKSNFKQPCMLLRRRMNYFENANLIFNSVIILNYIFFHNLYIQKLRGCSGTGRRAVLFTYPASVRGSDVVMLSYPTDRIRFGFGFQALHCFSNSFVREQISRVFWPPE